VKDLLPRGVSDGTWVYVEHSKNSAYIAHVHRPAAIHTMCAHRSLDDLQRVRAMYVKGVVNMVEWCAGCFPSAAAFEVEPEEPVSLWRRFLNWLRA
jgi:hypothetical protein